MRRFFIIRNHMVFSSLNSLFWSSCRSNIERLHQNTLQTYRYFLKLIWKLVAIKWPCRLISIVCLVNSWRYKILSVPSGKLIPQLFTSDSYCSCLFLNITCNVYRNFIRTQIRYSYHVFCCQICRGGNWCSRELKVWICVYIHSFSSLSFDRSKASSKASSQHGTI